MEIILLNNAVMRVVQLEIQLKHLVLAIQKEGRKVYMKDHTEQSNPLLAEMVVFKKNVSLGNFNKKGFFQPYGREHLRDFQPMKPLYCIFDQNGRRGLFVNYKNIAFFSVFEDEIEPFIPAAN